MTATFPDKFNFSGWILEGSAFLMKFQKHVLRCSFNSQGISAMFYLYRNTLLVLRLLMMLWFRVGRGQSNFDNYSGDKMSAE